MATISPAYIYSAVKTLYAGVRMCIRTNNIMNIIIIIDSCLADRFLDAKYVEVSICLRRN